MAKAAMTEFGHMNEQYGLIRSRVWIHHIHGTIPVRIVHEFYTQKAVN